jgi:hypothetical protein
VIEASNVALAAAVIAVVACIADAALRNQWLRAWWAWRLRRPLVGDPDFQDRLIKWRHRRPNRKDYKWASKKS